jgi:superfamily II DNA or RNA helicase
MPGDINTRPAVPARVVLPPLRGYQQEAIDAIEDGLRDGGRGQLWAACGTGKTLVAVYAALRLCRAGIIAVACPSLDLVAQTLRVWLGTGVAVHVLAVCGDDSVTDSTTRVADLPCTVSTDATEISRWLRSVPAGELGLVMVTHASVQVLGKGLLQAGTALSVLVVDEAHHTAGWTGKYNALIHHDQHLPARRRLYLTATPRRLVKRHSHAGDDLMSMDDKDLFGPVLYEYLFSRAIADGWLDDYRILAVGVTSSEALSILREADPNAVTNHHEAPLRVVATQAALIRAATEFGLRRIVVFTSRVAQSREFARTLPRTLAMLPEQDRPKGPLSVAHVDGTQSIHQRNLALSRLADPPGGGWSVVVNARCLQEGVDVPAVDAVVYTQPKESPVDIAQSAGRGVRRNPEGSGIATLLVPVLLPDDPDDLSADATEWATTLQVLRAMRSHDGDIATELDAQRKRIMPDFDVAELPPRVLLRLPEQYRTEDLLRQITVRIIEGSTSDWLDGYAALQAFKTRHGHVQVPTAHRENGVALERWIVYQRTLAKKGRLPTEHCALLADIGVDLDPEATAWQRGLNAVTAYRHEHGHLRIPKGHRVDGIAVASWITHQRMLAKKGRLPDERRALLADVGVDFDPEATAWRRGLDAVTAYRHEHGNVQIPKGHRVDGIAVASWLTHQRTLERKGQLSAARRELLVKAGVNFDVSSNAWRQGLAAATSFYQEHGHLRVPAGYQHDGVNLSQWVNSRRSDHHRGRLAAARTAGLTAIGMVFDKKFTDPAEAYKAAEAFHDEHGHLDVPTGTIINGLDLYAWVRSWRNRLREEKLSPQNKARLDAMGMIWQPTRHRWNSRLEELGSYRQQHGKLPSSPRGDAAHLYRFWKKARADREAGLLDTEQLAALDALGDPK